MEESVSAQATIAVAGNKELGRILGTARSIYVSACAAEIVEAPRLFERYQPVGATVTGIFSPLVNRRSYASPEVGLRVRTFFMNRQLKEHLASGLVEYCPWRYGVIDKWLAEPSRFDTALIMLSPPDSRGRCSFGVQADFLPSFHSRIERIVGFINPRMPRTHGDTSIDYKSLAAVVEYDAPLVSLLLKAPDPVTLKIADRIAALVRDHSTVQVGIGQIPSQVLGRLGGHRGLRVHSGIVDDNILALESSGALDGALPIVTGTAIGSDQLYSALEDEHRFRFRTVSHTHALGTIAAHKRFTAINSVLQVDLLGQMSAEAKGGALVSSPGGLPEFVRGAHESDGGCSIIAVRARGVSGKPGGVVSVLPSTSPVTLGTTDADVIVTEFGEAHVRNLSFDKRAEAIISIAAPEDQEHLGREWARIRDEFTSSS
jgi:acyl-CoA hydrolase